VHDVPRALAERGSGPERGDAQRRRRREGVLPALCGLPSVRLPRPYDPRGGAALASAGHC